MADDDWGTGLDKRLDDYLAEQRDAKHPEGTVGLPAVLAALGADIRAARRQADADGHPTLALKDASVELDVGVTYDAEADAKVKFWVFTEAGLDLKRESTRTIHITLNLTPVDPTPIAMALRPADVDPTDVEQSGPA